MNTVETLLSLDLYIIFKVSSSDSNCNSASETCTNTFMAQGLSKEEHNDANSQGSKYVSVGINCKF